MEYRKIEELKKLPNNPRTIKDEQFKKLVKSIDSNPDYFEARPVILSDRTGELIIIAGNQRYEAAKQLKLKEIPTFLLKDLTEEREKEIIIRDNINNGDWDWDIIKEWDILNVKDWGVETPSEWDVNFCDYGEDFELPSGEKSPYQQMKFILSDEQAEYIKEKIKQIKGTMEYKQ